jgi:hypothetical protein
MADLRCVGIVGSSRALLCGDPGEMPNRRDLASGEAVVGYMFARLTVSTMFSGTPDPDQSNRSIPRAPVDTAVHPHGENRWGFQARLVISAGMFMLAMFPL